MGHMDRWLQNEFRSSRTELAVFRIAVSFLILVCYVPTGMWLKSMPFAFFSPPAGIAAVLSDWPPFPFIQFLNVALLISASLLLVGWKTPLASLAASLCLFLLNSLVYASGKINHDILVVATPLVMAFSGWGDALSVDAERTSGATDFEQEGSASLAILAVITGFAMFTAGWAKLSTGWLSLETQSTYGHLLSVRILGERTALCAELAMQIFPRAAWEIGDWCATLLELAFLPAVLSRRVFQCIVAVACLFHLAVWLLFDIAFAFNVVVYAGFANYDAVPGFLKRIPPLIHARHGAGARLLWGGAAVAVLCGIVLFYDRSLREMVRPVVDRTVLIAGSAFAVCFLVSLLRRRPGVLPA